MRGEERSRLSRGGEAPKLRLLPGDAPKRPAPLCAALSMSSLNNLSALQSVSPTSLGSALQSRLRAEPEPGPGSDALARLHVASMCVTNP